MKNVLKVAALLMVIPLAGCGPSSSSSSPSSSSSSSSPTPVFDYDIENVSNAGSSVMYEIFVGSFFDSDNNYMGDFDGVTSKLDYLESLGVGGIWFMPIMPSPSYHKYDITDYKAIDSHYGTMADFDEYMTAASAHHIDTIIDLVVNHTSNYHPWFLEAIDDYQNGNCDADSDKCNYYNFSDHYETGYNQYGSTGIYYESRFWSGMPDLNLDNPVVRDEITSICHFWLDKGVKGFRLDAVTSYYTGNASNNIDFLSWLNGMVKAYKSDSYIVGEGPWDIDAATIQNYYHSGIDSFFNFTVAQQGGYMVQDVNAEAGADLATYIADYNLALREINPNAIDAPFLSNHDLARSAGYYFGTNADYKRKLAASSYLLMPGKPFIYYGEEIGLKGSGNDQSKRLPMIWSETDKIGQCDPPSGYDYNLANQVKKGATDLLAVPDSLTNHYRKTISLRNKYNGYIESGAVEAVSLGSSLFALRYSKGTSDSIVVITNFAAETATAGVDATMTIADEIATMGIAANITGGTLSLAGFSSVILQ